MFMYTCVYVCMYYLDMYKVAQLLCKERDERRLEGASQWLSMDLTVQRR